MSDEAPAEPGRRSRPGRAALRRELRVMARDFADQLVGLLERAGFWDERHGGEADDEPKRVRRSSDTLDDVKELIVAELKQLRGPVGIGAVAAALGMKSRQITHPMSLLVEEGKIVRHGVRRGARYEIAPRPKRPAAKKKKPARRPR
jgi:hypothetical protein